jgi:hypothetical protein
VRVCVCVCGCVCVCVCVCVLNGASGSDCSYQEWGMRVYPACVLSVCVCQWCGLSVACVCVCAFLCPACVCMYLCYVL